MEVEISDDVVFIRGNLCFSGFRIEATQDDLFLGQRSMIQMRDCTTRGAGLDAGGTAIALSTGKIPFSDSLLLQERACVLEREVHASATSWRLR